MDIKIILERQKEFFNTGKTKNLKFRIMALKRLSCALEKWEDEILHALKMDLGKSRMEAYMCEIGMVKEEISYMRKNLPWLSARRKATTPLVQFPAESYSLPQPYGSVLIMSPWNYPFLLTLGPAIDALAAGNTVIVKPSAYSPHTSKVIKQMLNDCLPSHLIYTVEGGRDLNTLLLEQKYDYIFFTGSVKVGQLVLEKAARYVTPVTLELGGKSPCIVDETADLKKAAKRIVFGKYLNLGQTCVAPDYLLVQKSVKNALMTLIEKEICRQFGHDPLDNPDYGKIINDKHFQRLTDYLTQRKIIIGGKYRREARQIEPTVIDNISLDDTLMKEEIFGPILPVLTFEEKDEIILIIDKNPTPLALYLFTTNEQTKKQILNRFSFGGGCVNDTIMQTTTPYMGFGGVGQSGMGSYHGKSGFNTFTHYKSIIDKKKWPDLPIRYQPYNALKETIARKFLGS